MGHLFTVMLFFTWGETNGRLLYELRWWWGKGGFKNMNTVTILGYKNFKLPSVEKNSMHCNIT